MFVRSVSISREGDWDSDYGPAPNLSKPFLATIKVHGQNGEVKPNLSPDLSTKIMAIIAEEVAAAGRATAEAMTAETFNVVALPKPKGAA